MPGDLIAPITGPFTNAQALAEEITSTNNARPPEIVVTGSRTGLPPSQRSGNVVVVNPGAGNIGGAIDEAGDACSAGATAQQEEGHELPKAKTYSGQFIQRVPKSLHMQLARRAAIEGVSLNQLATALLAQGLGSRGRT
jgi:antitoxin HicB